MNMEVAWVVEQIKNKDGRLPTACGPSRPSTRRRGTLLLGGRFGLVAFEVFVQPRHDLGEVARVLAVVELLHENAVPGVATGAGRTWQTEDEGRADEAGDRPRLHRRSADLVVADAVEDRAEPVHALVEQRLDRVRRHVATGKPGAASGEDHVDLGILQPALDRGADLLGVVGDDGALDQDMAG